MEIYHINLIILLTLVLNFEMNNSMIVIFSIYQIFYHLFYFHKQNINLFMMLFIILLIGMFMMMLMVMTLYGYLTYF